MHILKDHSTKILIVNHFLFFHIISKQPLRKYIKNFNNLLCSPFSLYTTSKNHQVERLASQGEAGMFLERFSPWAFFIRKFFTQEKGDPLLQLSTASHFRCKAGLSSSPLGPCAVGRE